jgi:enamine deaminase RidA (YjgF/YER057c/UK114 family)
MQRFETTERMSQAVVHGDLIFLSGQVDKTKRDTVAEQTAAVLSRIDALLDAADSDKAHIISANIWLADIGSFAEMNSVWDKWVAPGATPTRATVEARLADPKYHGDSCHRGAEGPVTVGRFQPLTVVMWADRSAGCTSWPLAEKCHRRCASVVWSQQMDREQCAPPGLLNADDSIVLLIDLQQPFLKKLEAEESARVVDHCRFIVEVAQRFVFLR